LAPAWRERGKEKEYRRRCKLSYYINRDEGVENRVGGHGVARLSPNYKIEKKGDGKKECQIITVVGLQRTPTTPLFDEQSKADKETTPLISRKELDKQGGG